MSDIELTRKYFDNQCTHEEKLRVIEFISNNKGNSALNQIIDEYWDSTTDETINNSTSETIYDDIIAVIDAEQFSSSKERKNKYVYFSYLKYAAGFLMLVTLGYLMYKNENILLNNKSEVIVQTQYILKQTSKGQKSTIILSDGSKVILNSASSIRYPQSFTDSTRLIELNGEAFFEVAVDKKRPFIVQTNEIRTIALGTSFNINSKSPSLTKVSLATGKVMIEHDLSEGIADGNSRVYFLEPGEALSLNRTVKTVSKFNYDSDEDLLWKDGILYFKDCSFKQIVEKLEPWFDVKIQIKNEELATKKYTGKFDNVSLEHLLKNVGFTLEFDFFINDKNAIIIFNN